MKHSKSLRRILALVLVLTMVLSLVNLTAFAVEDEETLEPICGKEEHVHTEACYIIDKDSGPICGQVEGPGHTHTDECKPVISKELTCELEETGGHTHTDECYGEPVTELTCGKAEGAGHKHSISECFKLVCTETVAPSSGVIDADNPGGHMHNASCYVQTCELEESDPHTHTAECYTTTTPLVCGKEEVEPHTHSDECYTQVTTYSCGLEESEGHTHSDECYSKTLICEMDEHTHDDTCYELPQNSGAASSIICDGTDISGETCFYRNDGPHTITVDGEWNGTLSFGTWNQGDYTVNIVGSGTINANGIGSAITVDEGVTVILNGPTVTGGVGTDFTNIDMEPRGNHTFKVGGGVYVRGGNFELQNGTITGNTAQRGGGIFVNNGASFKMTGGSVTNNQTIDGGRAKYAGEGGGIFVYGTATISGGSITYNTCNSQTDLGGGGLYINNSGIATLINATVTENTAYGWGGGIAGCCHGEMSLVATDGVALYGNTAKGESHTLVDNAKGANGVAEIIDHYNAASAEGITGANSADFYTAGSSIISNYMAGGGSARYTARVGNADVKIADNEVKKYETTNVALKADPTQESKDKVPAGVLISNNKSHVHGGGIGCNGGLYFGSAENQTIEIYNFDLDLNAKKEIRGRELREGAFTFGLYQGDTKVATAKNDANGNIHFDITNSSGLNKDLTKHNWASGNPTVTLTLKEIEIPASDKTTKYDRSEYEITLSLDRGTGISRTEKLEHTTNNNGFRNIEVTYTIYTVTATVTSITQTKDKDGNDCNNTIGTGFSGTNSGVTFTNEHQYYFNFSLFKKATVNGFKTQIPVKGATFALYRLDNSTGEYVTIDTGKANLTTNDAGEISFELGPISVDDYESIYKNGGFFFQEVTAPDGFKLSEEMFPANKTADLTYSAVATNDGDFEKEFSKTDMYGEDTAVPGATFELRIWNDKTQKWEKVSDDDKTVTDENGHITFKGLIPGAYKLTETVIPEGYQTQFGEGITNDFYFTVKADGTWKHGEGDWKDNVTLMDRYALGSLIISKEVVGVPTNQQFEINVTLRKGTANDDAWNWFTKHITSNGSYGGEMSKYTTTTWDYDSSTATITLHLVDGGSFTINNIPKNVEYVISESKDGDNLLYQGTVEAAMGQSYKPSVYEFKGIIEEGKISEAKVQNVLYVETEKDFTVKKVVTETIDGQENNPGITRDFTFELRDWRGTWDINPIATTTVHKGSTDGEAKFTGLTFKYPGTYWYQIAEKHDAGNYWTYAAPVYVKVVVAPDEDGVLQATVTYYSGYEWSESDHVWQGTGEIENWATFTNTRLDHEAIDVDGFKYLDGNYSGVEFTFQVQNLTTEESYTVTNSTENDETMGFIQFFSKDYDNFDHDELLIGEQSKSGYICDPSVYLVVIDVEADTETQNGLKSTVTITKYASMTAYNNQENGEVVDSIRFDNTTAPTIPTTGSLTITKAISGGGEEAANKTYTFTITGPNNYSRTVTITGSGSTTVRGLTAGTYTVTEANADIEGWKWSVSGEGDVTVTGGGTVNVTITNTYDENSDNTQLTVNKIWVGDDELTRPNSITVQLTKNGAAEGSPVTLSAANGWSYQWTGLDATASYSVTEVDVPAGYTSSTTVNGRTYTITNTYGPDDDIPDDDTPLDEFPEFPDEDVPLTDFPDEDVPLADIPDDEVPKTGDESKLVLWLALLMGSGLGLTALGITGKKRKED